MRKLLFRSRSGEGYPMVIAVTLCLLMLFMVIAQRYPTAAGSGHTSSRTAAVS